MVGAQAGDATVEVLDAVVFEATGPGDVTGGDVTAGASRMLTGIVADPVLGVFSVLGHADFVPAGTLPSSFTNGTVTHVELVLDIDYVYGDTTEAVTLELADVTSDWTALSRRADTTLSVGPPITTVSFSPHSTVARVVMPDDWTMANDALLRSSTFLDDFHGFRFKGVAGNSVVGINLVNSAMRISAAPGDTVTFAMSKVLSTMPSDPPLPGATDRVLLQDGGRSTITLQFPLVENAAIHQAVIRANLAVPPVSYPAGFSKPEFRTVSLRAVSADDKTRLPLLTIQAGEDGTVLFDDPVIGRVLQQAITGESTFDRFELYIPVASSTVGSHVFQGGPASGNGPRLVVTYTPFD